MDSQALITRRDVVAMFLYIFIVAHVLLNLIQVLGYRIAGLFLHSVTGTFGRGAVDFIPFVLLLFWPLVPLIALGVTGRYAKYAVTKRDIRSLVLCCAGLVICALSLPMTLVTLYYWRGFAGMPWASGVTATYQSYVIGYFASFFFGFVLAFFPTIFDTICTRANAEEGSSTF